MRSLKITTENFENQRNAVKEERLMRIDNQPYGAAFITSDTLSYDFRPYSHSVIGKMVDLDAAEIEDVQRFFDRHYSPNNAVLTVVGDINKKQVKKSIEEYFGTIPRAADTPPISGSEPPHKDERRLVIEDKNANVPAIFVNYVIPTHLHDDTPALELLGKILTDGESSRMYQKLVKDEEAAVVVFGGVDSRKGPSLFRFIAASNVGVDISTVEQLMLDELELLKVEGIDPQELEKAKIQFRSDYIRGRETVMDKAEALQHFAYYHDDIGNINVSLDKYMAVTSEDIMRVAKKYFITTNRTSVVANPAGKESL
jgi:predicted Zn-dependent peptidase